MSRRKNGAPKWVDKSKEERKANSRDGHMEVVDEWTWRKWCENCGKPFTTVNESRKLCTDCFHAKCDGGGFKKLLIGTGGYQAEHENKGVLIESFDCPHCGAPAWIHKTTLPIPKAKVVEGGPKRKPAFYCECRGCDRCQSKWYGSEEDAKAAFAKEGKITARTELPRVRQRLAKAKHRTRLEAKADRAAWREAHKEARYV